MLFNWLVSSSQRSKKFTFNPVLASQQVKGGEAEKRVECENTFVVSLNGLLSTCATAPAARALSYDSCFTSRPCGVFGPNLGPFP